MARITVTFEECVQDSQEYGSTDEHMVSRLWVEIAVDGQDRGSYIADLKQTVGSDFDTGDIEVGPPVEVGWQRPYAGPFNHNAFTREASAYYRSIVGESGQGIRTRPGQPLQMEGNRFMKSTVVTFEASS